MKIPFIISTFVEAQQPRPLTIVLLETFALKIFYRLKITTFIKSSTAIPRFIRTMRSRKNADKSRVCTM